MKAIPFLAPLYILFFVLSLNVGSSLQATPHDGEEEPSSRPFSPLTQPDPLPPVSTDVTSPVPNLLTASWTNHLERSLEEQSETLEAYTQTIFSKFSQERAEVLIRLTDQYMRDLNEQTPFCFNRCINFLDTIYDLEKKYPGVLDASYGLMMNFYRQNQLPYWDDRRSCLSMASYLIFTNHNVRLSETVLGWFYTLTSPHDDATLCNTFFHRLYDLTNLYPETYTTYLTNLRDFYHRDPLERKVGYLEGLRDATIVKNPLSPPPPSDALPPQSASPDGAARFRHPLTQ